MDLLNLLTQHAYGRKYALALVTLGALLVLGLLAALLPAVSPHVITLAGSMVAIYATFVTGHTLDPSSKTGQLQGNTSPTRPTPAKT